MNQFIDKQISINAMTSFMSKGFNLFVSLVSVIVVLSVFNEVQQGIFYVILSILSFALAVESGLTLSTGVAITNQLKGISADSLEEFKRLVRFDATLRAIIGFSLIAFFIVFLVVIFVVTLVASQATDLSSELNVNLFIYLAVIVLFSYFNLVNQSIYEGCGQIGRYQKLLLVANIFGLGMFGLAVFHGEYTLALLHQYFFRSLILMLLMNLELKFWEILFRPWNTQAIAVYAKNISIFQIKLGVSCISGAVMYYSIVPLIGLSGDLVTAGVLGLCFQLFHAILGLSLSWQVGSQPAFVNYLLASDRKQFFKFVNRISMKCLKTANFVSVITLASLYFLDLIYPILYRFGSLSDPMVFCLTAAMLAWVSPKTAAIRANKEDPFMFLSVCTAIAVALTSWSLSHDRVVDYLPQAFLLIMIVQTICIVLIFNNWNRKNVLFNRTK